MPRLINLLLYLLAYKILVLNPFQTNEIFHKAA